MTDRGYERLSELETFILRKQAMIMPVKTSQKDVAKAIELWHRSADLGFPPAVENIRLLEGQSTH
jgi:hypothetical protein